MTASPRTTAGHRIFVAGLWALAGALVLDLVFHLMPGPASHTQVPAQLIHLAAFTGMLVTLTGLLVTAIGARRSSDEQKEAFE